MTARIVISCDGGPWAPGGVPCRGALPTRKTWPDSFAWRDAYREAKDLGWKVDSEDGRDLCPACARREAGR